MLDELRERAEVPSELELRLTTRRIRRARRALAGRRRLTFVHVSGEAGIGAGIVLHGELLRGRHGFAGEIGHLPVPGSDVPCACGATGCLEQVAGEDALGRAAGAGRVRTPSRRPPPPGTEQALGALGAAGRALGTALAGVRTARR